MVTLLLNLGLSFGIQTYADEAESVDWYAHCVSAKETLVSQCVEQPGEVAVPASSPKKGRAEALAALKTLADIQVKLEFLSGDCDRAYKYSKAACSKASEQMEKGNDLERRAEVQNMVNDSNRLYNEGQSRIRGSLQNVSKFKTVLMEIINKTGGLKPE